MITKIIAQNTTGSFKGLADYLVDKLDLQKDKVEDIFFKGTPFENEAVSENIEFISSHQQLNQNTNSDKTMHIIVSFQEDEKPSLDLMKTIEEELIKSLGMQEHHRLCVTHNNTNNFHVHIALDRVNPITKNLIDPFQSKRKLAKKAAELEEKYKLKKDNHGLTAETKANKEIKDIVSSIEAHSGIQSFTSWCKKEISDDLKALLADNNATQDDLYKTLAKYNLTLELRGNGIVIRDKTRKLFTKASNIDRNLSKTKLEKRFGTLVPKEFDIKPVKQFGLKKSPYWDNYNNMIREQKSYKSTQSKKISSQYHTEKEKILKKYKKQRLSVRLIKAKRQVKQKYYQDISKKQKNELKKLREEIKKERDILYLENRHMSYKEYLIKESLAGDTKALEVLQSQKEPVTPKNDENTIGGTKSSKLFIIYNPTISNSGYVVYKLDDERDNSKVIDKGTHLKLVNTSDEVLLKSLQMATEKYGKRLKINGSDAFKSRVISLAIKHKLDISFQDKNMQKVLLAAKHNRQASKSDLER